MFRRNQSEQNIHRNITNNIAKISQSKKLPYDFFIPSNNKSDKSNKLTSKLKKSLLQNHHNNHQLENVNHNNLSVNLNEGQINDKISIRQLKEINQDCKENMKKYVHHSVMIEDQVNRIERIRLGIKRNNSPKQQRFIGKQRQKERQELGQMQKSVFNQIYVKNKIQATMIQPLSTMTNSSNSKLPIRDIREIREQKYFKQKQQRQSIKQQIQSRQSHKQYRQKQIHTRQTQRKLSFQFTFYRSSSNEQKFEIGAKQRIQKKYSIATNLSSKNIRNSSKSKQSKKQIYEKFNIKLPHIHIQSAESGAERKKKLKRIRMNKYSYYGIGGVMGTVNIEEREGSVFGVMGEEENLGDQKLNKMNMIVSRDNSTHDYSNNEQSNDFLPFYSNIINNDRDSLIVNQNNTNNLAINMDEYLIKKNNNIIESKYLKNSTIIDKMNQNRNLNMNGVEYLR